MKKIVIFVFTLILLASSITGCATDAIPSGNSTEVTENNDYATAKTILTNYGNAIITAWKCGINDDCIYKNESIKDFESPENVDISQLVDVTGINKEKIEELLRKTTPEFSRQTVNLFSNKYYAIHHDGIEAMERYNVLNKDSELDEEQYTRICYNLEMVKYLYTNICNVELAVIFGNNSVEDEDFKKLVMLQAYADALLDTCLDNSQYTSTFPSNLDVAEQEIQALIQNLN